MAARTGPAEKEKPDDIRRDKHESKDTAQPEQNGFESPFGGCVCQFRRYAHYLGPDHVIEFPAKTVGRAIYFHHVCRCRFRSAVAGQTACIINANRSAEIETRSVRSFAVPRNFCSSGIVPEDVHHISFPVYCAVPRIGRIERCLFVGVIWVLAPE